MNVVVDSRAFRLSHIEVIAHLGHQHASRVYSARECGSSEMGLTSTVDLRVSMAVEVSQVPWKAC